MATVGLLVLNGKTGVALRIVHYYICVVNLKFWANNGFLSREMANNRRIMPR